MSSSRRRQRNCSNTSPSSFVDDCDDGLLNHPSQRRRSARGSSCMNELAKDICLFRKRVLFIVGAGMSVASGVRPFRGDSGVWTSTIWTNATRDAFRKDPLKWYNEFWLPNLRLPKNARPNAAHLALHEILKRYPETLHLISQNVDGLHPPCQRLVEAHGRLGLYKCIPAEDSDTDSDSDDDDQRDVHLGHRRKWRLAMKKQACPYQQQQSLSVDDLEPIGVRKTLKLGRGRIPVPPRCPSCSNAVAPQALLFDEGYHSHDFYQFQRMEEWLAQAEVVVFVGTSFAVRLPEIALEHARTKRIPVYNFNTHDMLDATSRLDATNVKGPSEDLIPRLLQEIQELESILGIVPPMEQDEALQLEDAPTRSALNVTAESADPVSPAESPENGSSTLQQALPVKS